MAVLRYVLKKSFRSTKLPFSKPSQALPSPIYINNYAVVFKSAITVLLWLLYNPHLLQVNSGSSTATRLALTKLY